MTTSVVACYGSIPHSIWACLILQWRILLGKLRRHIVRTKTKRKGAANRSFVCLFEFSQHQRMCMYVGIFAFQGLGISIIPCVSSCWNFSFGFNNKQTLDAGLNIKYFHNCQVLVGKQNQNSTTVSVWGGLLLTLCPINFCVLRSKQIFCSLI